MFYRLTGNVFIQGDPKRRAVLPWCEPQRSARGADPLIDVHLVPFFQGSGKAADVQKLTADSILAAAGHREARIQLVSATLESERAAVPEGFRAERLLSRTVLDLHAFRTPRPLPLLFDVLELGASAGGRHYLCLSNADICVQPHFYAAVGTLLRRGFDCLIVNRRSVGGIEQYGSHGACAAVEVGKAHPGADCFIFPASWLGSLVRSDACVGAGFVMRSLIYNLVGRAEALLILEDASLTYHYGDDAPWSQGRYADYTEHNRQQAARVFSQLLESDGGAAAKLREFARVFNHRDVLDLRSRRRRWWSPLRRSPPGQPPGEPRRRSGNSP